MRIDKNHGYNNLVKFEHRARVLSMYRNLVIDKTRQRLAARNTDDVCITLASCVDNGKTHPSNDIAQWSHYFGNRFVAVNWQNIERAVNKHHPGTLFYKGDGFATFAKLAPFHKGLFYLDTTNTMELVARDTVILSNLASFLRNGKKSTMLAMNLIYNRVYVGESKAATDRQIRAKIKAITRNLPLDGWTVAADYDTYTSTKVTRMVTIFIYRKR